MRNVLLFLLLSITLNNISLAANKWALLVGVSHYPKANGWNDLAADNDVDIVKEALNKQAILVQRLDDGCDFAELERLLDHVAQHVLGAGLDRELNSIHAGRFH